MSHYAEMKVNIYILPTNLPTQPKHFFQRRTKFKTELKQNGHHRKINCFNFTWNV